VSREDQRDDECFPKCSVRGSQPPARLVLGIDKVPAATRLGIYGGAYGSRLEEALANNFRYSRNCWARVNSTHWRRPTVRAHESPFFSIRYYGGHLAGFLATDAQYAGAPVLAELAQWEWALGCAFDAADATPLTHEALARIQPQQWAQLRFGWHPSAHRLLLHWNAPQLWQAVTEDSARPEASFSAAAVAWLVWRQDLTTYFRSLPKSEAAVLDAARKGWPFGELCTLLCAEVGDAEAPMQAATLLRGWIGSGLITSAD
jgi:hypothetical protein